MLGKPRRGGLLRDRLHVIAGRVQAGRAGVVAIPPGFPISPALAETKGRQQLQLADESGSAAVPDGLAHRAGGPWPASAGTTSSRLASGRRALWTSSASSRNVLRSRCSSAISARPSLRCAWSRNNACHNRSSAGSMSVSSRYSATARSSAPEAAYNSASCIEAFDGVGPQIEANAPYQRQELLGIGVHQAWIEPQHAPIEAHSVSLRASWHLLELSTQPVAQLTKPVRSVIRNVVLWPERLHGRGASDSLSRLAGEIQQEFPGLCVAATTARPDLPLAAHDARSPEAEDLDASLTRLILGGQDWR